MEKTKAIDERTQKYRETLDQLIVGVEDVPIEGHQEPWRSWLTKNRIILEDIERLKNDTDDKAKISAFLLESQYIEFKIIELLTELEIVAESDPNIIYFNGKKHKRDLYEMSLGQLHKELIKYQADFLKKLLPFMDELNTKRIQFAHYLFSSIQGIENIIQQAKEGLAQNEKVMEELALAFNYIAKNTWYGQMYERKRTNFIKNQKPVSG